MVRPDDGAVDHLEHVGLAAAVGERLQQHVPDAGGGPAPELAVDRVPLPEFLGQVTPRRAGSGDPEDAVQRAPVVLRWAAAAGRLLRQERGEDRPLRIRQTIPNQGRPPLQRSASNHVIRLGGIPPVPVRPRGLAGPHRSRVYDHRAKPLHEG